MISETFYTIHALGRAISYPAGTLYRQVAQDFQSEYEDPILLAKRGGKLCELGRPLTRDCELTFLTARDKPGLQTYERSTLLLLLKAFYDVTGHDEVDRICVEHSVSHGLFLRIVGSLKVTEELLSRVEARMRELVSLALPITRSALLTEDAIDFFRNHHMADKAELMKYRLTSEVHLYTLDGYTDYFYGYMVPDTSYLTVFALRLFENGFVLELPDPENPGQLAPFRPSYKVCRSLYEATMRSEKLGVPNVGMLNRRISEGRTGELILAYEALMEKQIGDIAEAISKREGVRFVMIAGPSSSGKTTFSHRLSTQLIACGLKPHPIATDNFFKPRAETPRDENGNYDFECLEAMDVKLFNDDMSKLLQGETVELPTFNFLTGEREYKGNSLTLGENDVLVIEGIHCLNDAFSFALPEKSKFRIYISCLATLNVDDHNRIPTTDVRLLRRIARDAMTRGYSAADTIRMWPSVRRGEENNIFPYQDNSDAIFNSSLIYETAILKTYVEPLLFDIPHDIPEYIEAKRLLKHLSYFLAIPADAVPATSIAREFIGGGCFRI